MTPETATRIESDCIFPDAQSLDRPVTIDDFLGSCIVLIPGFSLIHADNGRNLEWSLSAVAWIDPRMHDDEIFLFDHGRQ